jgi:KEOPS complex subunit Pcc1
MILVTSSRKPAQRVRRLCRDLAFAVNGEYLPRGKAGLSDPLFSHDTVLILGSRGHGLGLQVISCGEVVADLSLCSVEEDRHAVAIHRAVILENEEINPRSRITVRLEGEETVVLEVEADDIAALRAALNMWLRLISVAAEMQEVAGKTEGDGQSSGTG